MADSALSGARGPGEPLVCGRAIVIDDEALAARRLRTMLVENGLCAAVTEFTDARRALDFLADNRADAAFVDMRMPGMDGLGFIERLNEINEAPAVVVTTAWLDHALDAYGPLTVAYLLKPIAPDDLRAAMDKVAAHLRHRRGSGDADPLLAKAVMVLVASEGKQTHRLVAGDIGYLKAESKYVRAYLRGGGSHWLNDSLNELVGRLDPLFARVHRNAAVNVRELASLRKSVRGDGDSHGLYLRLRGFSEEIEVSRSHHRQVRTLFKSIESSPGQ